jgi:hypothetical protein
MPTLNEAVAAVLKRLDTLVAAGFAGFRTGSFAQAWLCDDTLCSSPLDTTVYFAVVVLGAVGAAVLLWRYTRRWWSRAFVLPVALYAALIVPPMVWSLGRWTLRPAAGVYCVIRAGMPVEALRHACGAPSYGCIGPKFIASDSRWNPLAILICGFHGDVYGDHLVTYDCGGLAFSVEAFTGGRRPQRCLVQQ